MRLNLEKYVPVAFIVTACVLWGTDVLFRYPASAQWDRSALVFLEHLVGLLVLAPCALWKYGPRRMKPRRQDLPLILLIGIGGSAGATLFYTEAVRSLGPGATTILQMLQPALVVTFAYYFLGERHSGLFFQCAFWVILNAVLIAYPNVEFGFPQDSSPVRGAFFALLAMSCWAASTVAGKSLLNRYPPMQVAFYRWTTAVAFLGGWVLVRGTAFNWNVILTSSVLMPLLFLALVPGIGAMILYYHGLKEMPASVTTFVEQTNSVASLFFAAIFFDKPLSAIQWLGAAILMVMVFALAGLDNLVKVQPRPGRRPARREPLEKAAGTVR